MCEVNLSIHPNIMKIWYISKNNRFFPNKMHIKNWALVAFDDVHHNLCWTGVSLKMARIILILCLALSPLSTYAQVVTLKDAAQKAVLSNPEVLQRLHAYKATQGERDAAFGGYLPRLDLSASKGRDSRNDPQVQRDFTRQSTTLTLTQMLYDGFTTRNEVKRFDHAITVRLFELHDASETAALEASRAYIDVQRFRKLVILAEEYYVRHRAVFDQIRQRAQAGVGRRVDLEQATGRLALAESNLLTETSNLHDVSARYLRVVGEQPTKQLEPITPLVKDIPKDMATALTVAQRSNPALLAAIENVRSAQSASRVRDAAYQPRLDLRLRRDSSQNLNGIIGQHESSTAEVVMSWNLFSGLSDVARSRQFTEQHNVARDLRDKTCRDIRQTTTIAYNDTRKLTEQLGYLDQHQLAIEKARDAYRKQFDIGQRTLLDLLDSENELFQAKRTYNNAEYDLAIAYVRTYASLGKLLTTLGLSRSGDPSPELWSAGEDAPDRCPPDNPQLYVIDKETLNLRALELTRESAPPQQEPNTALPAAPEISADRAVVEALKAWSVAWSGRNVPAYLDSYAPGFLPAEGGTRASWEAKRRNALSRAKEISLEIKNIQFAITDATHASTTFNQTYRSGRSLEIIRKTLEWELVGGRWLIVKEITTKLPANEKQSAPLPQQKNSVLPSASIVSDAKPVIPKNEAPSPRLKVTLPIITPAVADVNTPEVRAPEPIKESLPPPSVARKETPEVRAPEPAKESAAAPPQQKNTVTPPAPDPSTEQAIAKALKAWALAWSGRNMQSYLDAYAPDFLPIEGETRAAWETRRKSAFSRAGDVSVEVNDIKFVVRDASHASTIFNQAYRSGLYQNRNQKTLEWELVGGRWLIVKEIGSVLPKGHL